MNWVDAVVIGLLLLYMGVGLMQGFVQRILFTVVFVFALAFSFLFYPDVSPLVRPLSPEGWEKALAFLLLFIVIDTLGGLASQQVVRRVPPDFLESPVNKVAGVIPSLLNGIILLSFLLTFIVAMPASPAVKEDILSSRYGGLLVERSRQAEGSLADIFGGPVNDTLTFLTTVRPDSTESLDLNFQTNSFSVDVGAEEEMLRLLNEERVSRGLSPLTADPALREVARTHSADMFERGYFAHVNPDGLDPFDRIEGAGISFGVAGENLAYAPSVEVAHEGLMDSTGHRENILSPQYCRVGIGIQDGGIYGMMFSQEFACG
ncbi:MAG TPA: CvpA family protein [Dehalococcoidia bacterium]|nr:CvpA family protein [Dehalococcoidia bacterium]